MKHKLLILLLTITSITYSQNIKVDDSFRVPKVVDLSGKHSEVVEKINSQILDYFQISDFSQDELEKCSFYIYRDSFEIKKEILHIGFNGESTGIRLNYVEDEFYFDLISGEPLEPIIIPFQALFTLNGYLDFLNKYWMEGVRREFSKCYGSLDEEFWQIDDAFSDFGHTFYDIHSYSVRDNKLYISLVDTYDRYKDYPSYGISVELDSVKDYLNLLGEYVLIKSNYLSMSPIDKFIENERLEYSVKNNLFIFGRIDDKYPFSMAINIDKENQVKGYYYYDSKMQNLNLKGQLENDRILLIESFNDRETGIFEFRIQKEYILGGFYGENKYIAGKWMNLQKSKSFDIRLTDIKTCDRK